jgi:sugar/nucleoside kinase (ribokinase family)
MLGAPLPAGGRAVRAQRAAANMGSEEHFDYTTLGHVTVDVLADGSRRPGGSAFYGALQAARLGRRARIITRGVPTEIEELLEPYAGELAVRIEPAAQTTTLVTAGSGEARRQRLTAWAGEMTGQGRLRSTIVHLAPVARELAAKEVLTSGSWPHARFVGLTPQGLVRRWPPGGGEVALAPDTERATAWHCDAVVVHALELAVCERLVCGAARAGAVVAITAGEQPTRLLFGDGRRIEIPSAPIERPLEDLGAGDVFAAAFFIALQQGEPAEQAAHFARAAAAVRMRGHGASAIGERAEIEAQLATAG